MIDAAVIGLGLAGFRFELDPLRSGVWSHAAAYSAADGVRLVAAVDMDSDKRRDFSERYPDVAVYASVADMLAAQRVDLAAVCVPTPHHAAVVRELVGRVRGVFCEKPMGSSLAEAREIVSLCREKGAVLAVNFVRRWESAWLAARQAIRDGAVGEVRTITGRYPGELYNIGTHLIDIMGFLAGRVRSVAGIVTHHEGEREPSGSALVVYESGATGTITTHGIRRNALFEVEIIGSEGRIQILENGRRTACYRYAPSVNYSGYNEMVPAGELACAAFGGDRMMRAVADVVACLNDPSRLPSCSGDDALHAQEVVNAIIRSNKEQTFVGC
ncbi:MAG: Gfo/Idh/MocA family protein [Thermodesulfobacteriota bacterium]